MNNKVKALFIKADKPYKDFGDILQVARAEACKILGVDKVDVLNILSCSYPKGYVAVVQTRGGNAKRKSERCIKEEKMIRNMLEPARQ